MPAPTPTHSAALLFAATALDPESPVPLTRQLYDEIRGAIAGGRLLPGARLPSTRALASGLSLSRNTVLAAFDQLTAEGYLVGRVGSGTRVAQARPEDVLEVHVPAPAPRTPGAKGLRLSARGRMLARTPVTVARTTGAPRPFRPGLPALEEFPFEVWKRLAMRFWDRPPGSLLGYGDPAGYPRLREAIAQYLRVARAVRCDSDQVVVVSGSQQALDLVANLLLDPGDAAWIEDPGYIGARAALTAAGARLVPVDVDEEGLDVAGGIRRAPRARLAYVTPSHQFPTGAVLSRPRRLALLAWAKRQNAWIIEDDYDSEFRYQGWPLESLQGLDDGAHVLYVGTFSKVLFPSLRLGYLVVPKPLVPALEAARGIVDRQPPGPEQAILADFLAEGHFARHVRRMRILYGERQRAMLDAAGRGLSGLLTVPPSATGMHLIGLLPPGVNDQHASERARALGVEAPALSRYSLGRSRRSGFLLGYAAFDARAIGTAVASLARALRESGPMEPKT